MQNPREARKHRTIPEGNAAEGGCGPFLQRTANGPRRRAGAAAPRCVGARRAHGSREIARVRAARSPQPSPGVTLSAGRGSGLRFAARMCVRCCRTAALPRARRASAHANEHGNSLEDGAAQSNTAIGFRCRYVRPTESDAAADAEFDAAADAESDAVADAVAESTADAVADIRADAVLSGMSASPSAAAGRTVLFGQIVQPDQANGSQQQGRAKS